MRSQPCQKFCRRVLWLACILIALVAPARRASAQAFPSISQQPQSQSVLLSSNVAFNVVASGQSPLDYRWHFNGVPLINGGSISGATNATLLNSNVLASDAGNYFITVTNRHGMITSAVATLTVLMPPAILSPPADVAVLLGSNTALSVTASGEPPLWYRWQKDGVNLTDDARISGAGKSLMLDGNLTAEDADCTGKKAKR